MRSKQIPWNDAIRILRKRSDIDSALPMLEGSLEAFLAWRAFHIVAQGTTPSGNGKNQCQELLRQSLAAYSEVTVAASRFVQGLAALAKQSDATIQEWYCEGSLGVDAKQRATVSARRRIRREVEASDAGVLKSADIAYDLGEDMYAVRSSVIAHPNVHTTGNLYLQIVSRFANLAAVAACSGIALRAGLPLGLVMEDAGVTPC